MVLTGESEFIDEEILMCVLLYVCISIKYLKFLINKFHEWDVIFEILQIKF